ncbi:hypothetical protein [Paracoccus sp. (in: a-proteobacteria)]|uniref:hypothetical protein n=1 Tax=Paracoccus sp. TaxID=267 RepID=UPI00322067F9
MIGLALGTDMVDGPPNRAQAQIIGMSQTGARPADDPARSAGMPHLVSIARELVRDHGCTGLGRPSQLLLAPRRSQRRVPLLERHSDAGRRAKRLENVSAWHPARLYNAKPTKTNRMDSRYEQGTDGGQVSRQLNMGTPPAKSAMPFASQKGSDGRVQPISGAPWP